MSELLLSEEDQLRVATGLLNEGLFGIRENPEDFITLKSERRSPHYLDIRPGISDPSSRSFLSSTMADLTFAKAEKTGNKLLQQIYDHVAGTPEAMTSYAALIADELDMSLLQPRVDLAKHSGNKTPILGRFSEGDRVAEYDDVVTDGASKIATIKGLEKAGLVVVDYFVVVDREEGGAPQVKEATGIDITPALGVSGMVKILHAESRISQTQYDNVVEYISEYGDPHAKATLGVAA